MPGHQPAVALEDGTIGMLLERTPLVFERGKVFGNGQPDVAARYRGHEADQAGGGHTIDLCFDSVLRCLRHGALVHSRSATALNIRLFIIGMVSGSSDVKFIRDNVNSNGYLWIRMFLIQGKPLTLKDHAADA